ncbi:hypothetical protein HTSR_0036 [Halodesulfurarchaeum formicicum]|uniref:Uncharacterized protein n=1 Tax=Halodesulfurarchaeum formicicum TaxID=1873524 RepID=A0A1D8S1K0_9EURY|nr:hypothetical protein HTSR_0036 [Halodesulfurarchaeum formicicum]APE94512.1 hypothetical protein HSR6_0036 [Halodesulfurarchaeum formicicum]
MKQRGSNASPAVDYVKPIHMDMLGPKNRSDGKIEGTRRAFHTKRRPRASVNRTTDV